MSAQKRGYQYAFQASGVESWDLVMRWGDVDCEVAGNVRGSDAALDNFAGSRKLLGSSKFWGNRWRTQLSSTLR